MHIIKKTRPVRPELACVPCSSICKSSNDNTTLQAFKLTHLITDCLKKPYKTTHHHVAV